MTIITKGMGAVLKAFKKRKTLTISGSPKPKHRTVIIKKPSNTKLSDAQEASDIYTSKAKTKKEYKAGKK